MTDQQVTLPKLNDNWLWNRIAMMPKGTHRIDALRLIVRECELEAARAERNHLIAQAQVKAAREAFNKEAGND